MSLTQILPNLDSLKMVKEAKLKIADQCVQIDHYNTTIFKHDFNTNKTEINRDCSKTSNTMIYRVLDLLNLKIENCVNTHQGKKMNYSGSVE